MYQTQGVEVTYTPNGGTATTVRLIVESITGNVVEGRMHRGVRRELEAAVRVSEVATLARDDTFTISGQGTYRVLPETAELDGLEWHFTAKQDTTKSLGDIEAFPDQ